MSDKLFDLGWARSLLRALPEPETPTARTNPGK